MIAFRLQFEESLPCVGRSLIKSNGLEYLGGRFQLRSSTFIVARRNQHDSQSMADFRFFFAFVQRLGDCQTLPQVVDRLLNLADGVEDATQRLNPTICIN